MPDELNAPDNREEFIRDCVRDELTQDDVRGILKAHLNGCCSWDAVRKMIFKPDVRKRWDHLSGLHRGIMKLMRKRGRKKFPYYDYYAFNDTTRYEFESGYVMSIYEIEEAFIPAEKVWELLDK